MTLSRGRLEAAQPTKAPKWSVLQRRPNPTRPLQFPDFWPLLPSAPTHEKLGAATLVSRTGVQSNPCQEGGRLQLVKGWGAQPLSKGSVGKKLWGFRVSTFDHSVGGSRGAGRHGASCLALPRLCVRILFGSGSSGSFGSEVAVAQPSPKTLGLRD